MKSILRIFTKRKSQRYGKEDGDEPSPASGEGVAPDEIELEGELDDPSAGHFEGVTTVKREPTLNDFTLMQVLGKGSFGKVVLVKRVTSGRIYAMKILRKAQLVRAKQIERTKTERRVLQAIDHPFIMRLHYAFQVRSARARTAPLSSSSVDVPRLPSSQTEDKLYLVLDYCPGGELFFHLSRFRRFPEHVAPFTRPSSRSRSAFCTRAASSTAT